MRAAARLLLRAVRIVGWAVFVVVAVLFLAEKTGLLTVLARRMIAANLGAAGESLRIGSVALGWFEPSLRISGLEIGTGGDAVLLEHASVRFDPRSLAPGRPLRVTDVDVRGGHLRISPELSAWLRSASSRMPATPPQGARTWDAPSITVRDLVVDLDTQRFGRIPIGRIDAALRSDPSGPPVLTGRLVPSLSSGSGSSGEIFLSGQEFEPGAFDVQASAARIPISTDDLPPGTEIEGLRAHAPRGTLAVSAFGSFRLDGATPPRGSVRLALTDAEFVLVDGHQRIDGLDLDLDAQYAPSASADLWSPVAWRTSARVAGRWREVPFEATARLAGPPGAAPLLSGRLHVPRLPADHALLDLVGDPPSEENLWQALDPRGEVELWLGVRAPGDWDPGRTIASRLSIAAEVGLAGRAGVTYRGWTSLHSHQRDQGFPLPVDGVKGAVVCGFDRSRSRPLLLGIVDSAGNTERAFAQVEGIVCSHPVDTPASFPGHGYAEVDLRIRAGDLPLDDRMRVALRGLSGVVAPDTWEPFHLAGGTVDAELRLVRRADMPYAATALGIDLHDVSLSWTDIPAPISRAGGRLDFLSDGRSERGLVADLQGTSRTAAALRASVRLQTDPSVPATPESKRRLDAIVRIGVQADRMSLTGDDKKVLTSKFPWIADAMDPHAPRGFADVAYDFTRTAADARARTDVEVTARDAEITPSVFRVPATGVRGRVLVTAIEDSPRGTVTTRTRLAPLVGELSGDVIVSVIGSFPPSRLHVHAAGLDPANKSLLGALGQAISKPGVAGTPDLTAVSVEGPLDLTGDIGLETETTQASLAFRLFLRENSLRTSKSFRIDRMRGIVEVDGRVATADHVEASLAGTPLSLVDLRYASTADGYELTTDIGPVENVPLDRDHLQPFVDEKTLEALLGPLGWRGRIDIEEAHVRIANNRQGGTRLEFGGKLTPSDMVVQLGLPFEVRSASATIEQLIYEDGRVRAVCRIEDLFGTIGSRDLSRASVLLTYVEPRLSIERIQGELEGGEIRTLGERQQAHRGGTAFSIDLEEPFPFELALDLQGIELAGLLRGLFATNFATRGKVDCELRLTGDTQKILGIQGSGFVQMRDTRLWSIPVFRALFSQLGLDDQAVFDNMGANLRIRNGVLYTDDIWVSSPILELVGKGWIDFDGGLKQDLQVRYRLIDRLGPLTRLLYAIQKELLSVAIRGDLARPQVIFKAPWTRVSSDAQRYRSLPLPGFVPLPPRF
jgi:hypothetical protein